MSESSQDVQTTIQEVLDSWQYLPQEEKVSSFRNLPQDLAEDVFLALPARDQALLFTDFSRGERRIWIRFLAPDDAADVIQESSDDVRGDLLDLIDPKTRTEVTGLLSYREDEAGGLMSPRFARVRPDMLVAEALRYVRKQAQNTVDPIHYVYVLDSNQHLNGVLSLRQLFIASESSRICDVMEKEMVTIPDDLDQEAISQLFRQHRFVALPVVNENKQMQGVVTVDDVLDVSQEEATEDIQKLGGTEALDAPYPQVGLAQMIKKRAGWLSLLFVGEMFTTSAMHQFEDEIAKAVVLSLFVPLIISSGGNSGSQATSLIIRSIALGELHLRDWWRVLIRETICGGALGLILATIGMTRIFIWPNRESIYTQHYPLIALTVGCSLVGIVLFGSIVGSMLPFVLRKFRLDPASASAPLVATLVDVTGLIIYFEIARMILKNTLL